MASVPPFPPLPETLEDTSSAINVAIASLKLSFELAPADFDKAYPRLADGSHKRVRKIKNEKRYLFAHALSARDNASVLQELEAYERFHAAGVRTAQVSALVVVPLSANCGLKGLNGFLVEFLSGDKIKPLECAPTKYTGNSFDLLWSKSPLLTRASKGKPTKEADYRALIEDLEKLYKFSKTKGVYDFQGIYQDSHFTLIDPPQTAAPKEEHAKKLCWLMQMLNARCVPKAKLPKDCT